MLELYSEVKIYKNSNSYPEFVDIQIKAKTRLLYMYRCIDKSALVHLV